MCSWNAGQQLAKSNKRFEGIIHVLFLLFQILLCSLELRRELLLHQGPGSGNAEDRPCRQRRRDGTMGSQRQGGGIREGEAGDGKLVDHGILGSEMRTFAAQPARRGGRLGSFSGRP